MTSSRQSSGQLLLDCPDEEGEGVSDTSTMDLTSTNTLANTGSRRESANRPGHRDSRDQGEHAMDTLALGKISTIKNCRGSIYIYHISSKNYSKIVHCEQRITLTDQSEASTTCELGVYSIRL